MTAAVLDASAVLALLLGELGGTRVQAMLSDAAITTVNLSEVVGHFMRNGVAEGDARRVLDPLPFERVVFDEDLPGRPGVVAIDATDGLSFGDRACLALARRLGIPAITADRTWRDIADAVGVGVDLIR